ncbi:hypothetical protein E2542_SST19049 [Spatholobus suberectus]|nr:hypothetical protein E2542_SST19049 [Spatholobus suberectus]
MSTRRWPRHVRGRKKRAKLCLANNAVKPSLQKKLRELQGTVPGSEGMDMHTLFRSIEKYILQLEAKVTVLRSKNNNKKGNEDAGMNTSATIGRGEGRDVGIAATTDDYNKGGAYDSQEGQYDGHVLL